MLDQFAQHFQPNCHVATDLQREHESFIFITTRKRSLGQGNIFTCLSFCSRGVCLSACWDTTPPCPPPGPCPPGTMHPPLPCTPWDQAPPPPGPCTPHYHAPPGTKHPPPDHAPPGTMHPPGTEHAGRYGQRAGGTHPTGMQSCLEGILLKRLFSHG